MVSRIYKACFCVIEESLYINDNQHLVFYCILFSLLLILVVDLMVCDSSITQKHVFISVVDKDIYEINIIIL